MSEKQFRHRLHIVLVLFFICFAIIAARAVYLGSWAREHYLKTSEKMSVRNISIPAHRGSIFDKTGRKLIWTRHRFELWCTLPAGKKFSGKHKAGLEKNFPERNFANLSDWSVPLCLDLTTEDIGKLEPLIRTGYPLKIRTVRQRRMINNSFVEKRAGDLRNGKGISGWEKEYDSVLAGRNGMCRVVVDGRQNWIPGSIELLEVPRHGKNVTLSIDAEEEKRKEAAGQ